MRRRASRRFSRSFGGRKTEYLWVTSQVNDTAVAGSGQNNTSLVTGADWERGGSDARETCTLVRSIVYVRWHAADLMLYGVQFSLVVQDEDEAAVSPATISSNGNERWLRFGFVPQDTNVAFTSGSVYGATGSKEFESKQKVRLGNNDIVRYSIRNSSSTVGIVYSLMARCLLRLS